MKTFLFGLATILKWFDDEVVDDGMVDGSGWVARKMGGLLSLTQTGYVQNYALVVFAGGGGYFPAGQFLIAPEGISNVLSASDNFSPICGELLFVPFGRARPESLTGFEYFYSGSVLSRIVGYDRA